MSPELSQLHEHLADLEVFMASRAYVGYRSARREEIKNIQGRILLLRPISQDMVAQQLMAFGELDSQEEMEQTFEQARVELKARISEMTERENENATEMKI